MAEATTGEDAVMDDTAKDLIILTVLAEQGKGGLGAGQISRLTRQYEAPVSVRDVTTRLQHLMTRSYAIQRLNDPEIWHITPAGIKWAAQNRGK